MAISLGTQFGTLGFLPLDFRQEIWRKSIRASYDISSIGRSNLATGFTGNITGHQTILQYTDMISACKHIGRAISSDNLLVSSVNNLRQLPTIRFEFRLRIMFHASILFRLSPSLTGLYGLSSRSSTRHTGHWCCFQIEAEAKRFKFETTCNERGEWTEVFALIPPMLQPLTFLP